MIESTLNYLAPMNERPVYYLTKPPEGRPWRNTKGDRRVVRIRDARAVSPPPSLDVEGFALVPHETAVGDLYDPDAIRRAYYPEIEALVARATGAARVVAFDHNTRCQPKADRREDGAQGPVRFVHNDYTLDSGPRRVRDLLPEDAEALLRRRFAVVNAWKPIRGPVEETPLAFCAASSLSERDFVETSLVYADRTGEVYSLSWSESHAWYYYPAMRADEVLLLKCCDSDPSVARFTAHTAFDDPTSPADAAPRESVEVRTLVFYA